MHRVTVIGAGIAGVETAVTLMRTLPRAAVTLVSPWPSMRILPNLVYVPFGASEQGVDVRLDRALASEGVTLQVATCDRVDPAAHVAHLSTGPLEHDTVVVATGTLPEVTNAHRLRSLSDATRLRGALVELAGSGAHDRSIMLRIPSSCSWTPPAFELALLLAQWRDSLQLEVELVVVVEEPEPLGAFDLDAAETVRTRLEQAGVELITNAPAHRLDLMSSTLAVDFGALTAHRIPGLVHVGVDGFYDVAGTGLAALDTYVVGDAAAGPYKAGFAAGWHARRVALALGGDLSILGADVGGIPIDQCEYQMDFGDDETFRVRFGEAFAPLDGHELRTVDADVVIGRPDKLVGTLVHDLLPSAAIGA
ncbi:MAG: hypothetical protein JWM98_1179 [Thermoleophilia bacterium]|nr:hypothetical protein [Thermoleophilia bacterium]